MGIFSPDGLIQINGYEQVADSSTSGSPLPIPNTGVFTLITNDGEGARSSTANLFPNMTTLWDASTNSFDFSQLENGDSVDIRVDLTATVATISTTIDLRLTLGSGAGAYTLPVEPTLYYLTTGTKRIIDTVTIGLDDDNTRLNPVQLEMASTDNLSVVVSGFLIRVHKKYMRL